MKIAIKNTINFRSTDHYPVDELTIVVVQFHPEDTMADFIFNTIDYDHEIAYDPQQAFVDVLYELCKPTARIDYFYVLAYNVQCITIALQECEALQPQYKIDEMYFDRGLKWLYEKNDYTLLENNLEPLAYETSISHASEEYKQLPTIENYLNNHAAAIKHVYYPGAGMDFSPLQLFGQQLKGVEIYFSDYMSLAELLTVIKRLKRNLKSSLLTPHNFNQQSWESFWPTNIDRNEMFGHAPEDAWAWRFEFKSNHLDCTFNYLGTEGVQTAKILADNQLFPDVLVLQDHGGCTNYTMFGGDHSSLFQAMQNTLPKYILMDPTGAENTIIWPGYEQVTQVFLPKVFQSLPQNGKPRALFKRTTS